MSLNSYSILEDDDYFQDPIPANCPVLEDDDDFQEYTQANSPLDECPDGWVDVPLNSRNKHYDVTVLENTLHAWAKRENFSLVKAKSDLKKVYLVCTYSNRYPKSKDPNTDPKRLGSSYKTDCPFVVRITHKLARGFWSVNDPLNESEHTHNHPCTAAYNSITPQGKKRLATQADIQTIISMTKNNSKTSEIVKNLSKFDGNSVFNHQDVANIANEIRQGSKPNSKINDATILMNKMKEEGYQVRHQESNEFDGSFVKLKSLFFIKNTMLQNARKMGQVFIIDATYKTNNVKMPLVSVYGVHNLGGSTLINYPVAFAFVSNETEVTYKWVMKQFKELVVSSSEEKYPVFVTDKCTALMNALDSVFPKSKKILCVWHMMGNIRKELDKGRYVNEKIKNECISLVQKMIDTKDQSYFEECLNKFNTKSLDPNNILDYAEINDIDDDFEDDTSMNKAYNYLKRNWVPIKDKWAGHLTQKIAHFGCLTSQRAESGHAALKVNMSQRMDLFSAFLHMHKYWIALEKKTMLSHKIESQKVDTLMINNKKLDPIRRKVSRAALIAAHSACLAVNSETHLKKEDDVDETSCVCSARVNFMLPCVHTVLGLGNNDFQLEKIHNRWHLGTTNNQRQATSSGMTTYSSTVNIAAHSSSNDTATSSSENDTATSSSGTAIGSSTPVDTRQEGGNTSWRKLLLKMELRFRQLEGNSEQTDHLEELIADVMKESESTESVFQNVMEDKAILMPVSEDVRAPGRPKKEICHLPDWKKSRNNAKSRADQVESKVTTGKVKKQFQSFKKITLFIYI